MHSRPGKIVSAVLAAVLCLIDVPAARAQALSGGLAGTVTGPSGAAVAKATVSVKNLATSESVTATTNSRAFKDGRNEAIPDFFALRRLVRIRGRGS
jgi:hypothetical protein